MNRIQRVLFLLIMMSISIFSCKKNDTKTTTPPINSDCNLLSISNSSNVEGFGILSKLPGIWNGSIFSPTPLGNFPEWVVDFRPISASQISAKNELDANNNIFMSFFVVKHDCKYRMAFRNGGEFAGATRNTYMIIDSLSENSSQSFYRFVDPISGGNRVYTDITFKQDSLIMHVFSNKFNTLSTPVTHMIWSAKLKDVNAAQNAITHFNYPQKQLTRDFSTTFDNLSDAVFYTVTDDPYPSSEQPYMGNSNVDINITNPTNVNTNNKVVIIITTQPLFNGFVFMPSNLDFRSRYVYVDAENSTSFNFDSMHPGDYFVNAIYDTNGDLNFSSGDFMNSNFDIPFTLTQKGTSNAVVNINFMIP